MFFGATSTARNNRPQFVDLNLVPPEYRPRPFPTVSAGLGLLLVGCALMLYAVFYAKTYTDLEINQLNARVNQAETVVKAATGDPVALARQDQLRAMRNDFDVLAQREINWGDVFQTIGDAPPGIAVKSIGQSGYGVTVTGSASNASTAAVYLDKLRASNLFVDAALQLSPATGSGETSTATTAPTELPSAPPTLAPAAAAPAPPIQPPPTPRTNPPPAQLPVAVGSTQTPTRTASPTVSRSPTITLTPSPTLTSTPAYDFVLLNTQQVPTSNPMVGNSDIRGTVVDPSNSPVSGLVVEIDSEGNPPWSAQRTTDSSGAFDFNVSHGKFKVFVAEGHTQPAIDLYTGADGVPGTYGYQLSFQQTFVGSAPPGGFGSPTPTYTGSATATPSDTPISLGLNVASYGCATAYFQSNPSALVGNDAGNAIDGNLGTEWNAGTWTQNGNPLIWQWSLPSSPTKCTDGRVAGGLSDTQDQIEGFQLIPDQNPSGTTIHELWLYSDPACTTNIRTDNSVYFTWNGETSTGQILPLKISPPLIVRCVIVRTLADPSYVAWEEVQIFQAVAPPGGFTPLTPSSTPTVTGTPPTATNTPPLSSTPTQSSTPSPSLTPTPSLTPLPPVPGVNVAPGGAIFADSNGAVTCATDTPTVGDSGDPCAAIDNSTLTAWLPTPAPGQIQGLTVDLASPSFNPNAQGVSDVRVTIRSTGSTGVETYQVALTTSASPVPTPCVFVSSGGGFPDYEQLDCSFTTPVPGVGIVSLQMFPSNSTTQDGAYGVREFQVYTPFNGFPTATFTPLPSATNTPTDTPTSTPTDTPTDTPIPSDTPSDTPTDTPTNTPSQTPTITLTPTVTQTPSVTPTNTRPPRLSPTRTASRTPTAVFAGLGRGPGEETTNAPNLASNNDAKPANFPSPSSTPLRAQTGGPVDFTIILEVGSGTGYP
jgi:hypothetical protein